MHVIGLAPLLLSLLILSGCGESSFNTATQKQDILLMSTAKEVALGRKIAHQVIKEKPPITDTDLQGRVRTIGQRLAAVCDRQEIAYEFFVIEGKEVNAFSLPGGYVFLFEGLIKKAKDDDELAGVIAHEIAHVVARHAAKRYRNQLGMQIAQLASLATQDPEAAAGLGVMLQSTQLAYARDEEIEADRLAVKYMDAAGFEARALLSFMQTMHEESSKELHYLPRGIIRPQYGLTHPFVPERRVAIKEEIFGSADYIDYINIHE
jgi:predicted Zn-dependent protease